MNKRTLAISLLVASVTACADAGGRPGREGDRVTDEVSTFERRIADGTDDVEEMASGAVYYFSSDLELAEGIVDNTVAVGMRFTGVDVPRNAVITRAYVQFTADEIGTEPANLSIHALLTPDAEPFGIAHHAVSGPAPTKESVSWSPGAWEVEDAATSNERTPELRGVIQEIVALPQWRLGNAMSIVVSGSGTRTAYAHERAASAAALLHIEYTLGDGGADDGGADDDGADDGGDPSGDGEIEIIGTEEVYDSNGQNLSIARPSAVEAGDLLILVLHRTDDDLPLHVDGWTRVAECYKRDNGYDCSTEEECEEYHDEDETFCKEFDGGGGGHDLAQSIFYRVASSDGSKSYEFDLNVLDDDGHPGWAILTALRGADTIDPVRSWSHEGCDDHEDSMFPSVYGEEGDLVLLSQSFDDAIAEAKFGPPDGTSRLGYVSKSDEAGFLFGGLLDSTGETGAMKTHGDGGPSCKDALVSLTIKPE